MNQLSTILMLIGIAAIIIGLIYRLFPKQKGSNSLMITNKVNNFASCKLLKPVLSIFFGNESGFFHRTAARLLARSESSLSVHGLFLAKIASLILVAILVIGIRYTNMEITKQAIIARPSTTINIFTGQAVADYARNVELYIAVLKNIGEKKLQRFDDDKILESAERVLPEILKTSDLGTIKEQAAMFLSTFRKVNSIPLLDYWTLLVIIFSFWLPEAFLLSKRLLLTSVYRKEVIKLENIFELLGSVRGIKTFDILKEMAKASNIYRRHLTLCMEQFKTEKEEALESLKSSVRSTRFAKLVDVMRVFSLTDRKLALQILERNRFEQEEDMLITAEEDVDAVDLIAFISIVPVVWLLINLLLKPMLDTIFEVFKYV